MEGFEVNEKFACNYSVRTGRDFNYVLLANR